jgi:hypothetical protein
MRVSDKTKGFVFTFAGDEQASVRSFLFHVFASTRSNKLLGLAALYAIFWVDWSMH